MSEGADISDVAPYRFIDGATESCNYYVKLHKFNELPLKPLEKTVENMTWLISNILSVVKNCKIHVQNSCQHLTIDEAAAITLYTYEWTPPENSVYHNLNWALREEDRRVLEPWLFYLKLLINALSRLPSDENSSVYRCIVLPNHDKYVSNSIIVWWGFSSCSVNRNIALKFHRGVKDNRVLFIIECNNGKRIADYSKHKEEEILLVPGTTLIVTETYLGEDNIYTVHLKEIDSIYNIMKPQETLPLANSEEIQTSSLFREILGYENSRYMRFSMKNYSFVHISAIVQEAIGKKHCSTLTLQGKTIESQGIKILAQCIGRPEIYPSLNVLYFIDIEIDEIAIQALSKVIPQSNLKQICFNNNGFGNKGAEYLASMLKTNNKLTHLWLLSCHISDHGIQCLVKSLTDAPNGCLQNISLAWNRFHNEETVNAIHQMLETNRTLKEFILDGHGLRRAHRRALERKANENRRLKLIFY